MVYNDTFKRIEDAIGAARLKEMAQKTLVSHGAYRIGPDNVVFERQWNYEERARLEETTSRAMRAGELYYHGGYNTYYDFWPVGDGRPIKAADQKSAYAKSEDEIMELRERLAQEGIDASDITSPSPDAMTDTPESMWRVTLDEEAWLKLLRAENAMQVEFARHSALQDLVSFRFRELESSEAILDVVTGFVQEFWTEELEYSEHEFCKEVVDDIEEQLRNLSAELADADFPSMWEWRDYLEEDANFVYEPMLYEQICEVEIKANISFNVGMEWNREHTNINDAMGAIEEALEDGKDIGGQEDEYLQNNSLTWLMATQGRTWADFARNTESRGDAFLDSLRIEDSSMVTRERELTLCAKIRVETAAELIAGETNLEVHPDTPGFRMGLFNPTEGDRGAMAIKPEKPFVIGSEVLNAITCESAAHDVNTIGYGKGMKDDGFADCLEKTADQVTGLESNGLPCVDVEELNAITKEIYEAKEAEREKHSLENTVRNIAPGETIKPEFSDDCKRAIGQPGRNRKPPSKAMSK